jgi:hypothetical protein
MDQPRTDRRYNPPDQPPMPNLLFRAPPALIERVKAIAESRGVTISDVLREAVARGLAQEP